MQNYSDILYRPCLLKSSIEQIYQTPSKQAFWLYEVAGGGGAEAEDASHKNSHAPEVEVKAKGEAIKANDTVLLLILILYLKHATNVHE